jgi:hypothetical protein
MSRSLILIAAAALVVTTAQGATINILNTFDGGQAPPPGGPGPNGPGIPTVANGVHALGVTFTYTQGGNPSSAATYGDIINTGTNGLAPLTDPVLDGPGDGVLTLTFDSASTFLSFDIALFSQGVNSGGQVTIGGNTHTFTTIAGFGAAGLFSMTSFSWIPASPFIQAVISFDAGTAQMFVIDNLGYNVDPPDAAPAPEPASFVFMGMGALLLGMLARSRRARACCLRSGL